MLIMEENLGRLLTDNEVVHHIDGNKLNNNLVNLQLLTISEHAKLHAKENKAEKKLLKCPVCGIDFLIAIRNYKYKKNKGQKDFYCGRSCMAKHYGRGRPKSKIN